MSTLLAPLYYVVSWIMVSFHTLFTWAGLNARSGVTWALSIIGLVLVIRTLLIPLFVKQIKAQRALQMLQPEIKKVQEKYKHDRERQSQELMQLYRDRKANPFASCLPVLAQAPILLALFGVLNGIATGSPRGVMADDPGLVEEARQARLFGALLFDRFLEAQSTAARILAISLVLLMTASTYLQQRQILTKNMPAAALAGPYAQQQKVLMYVLPVVFGISGLWFPIGVLLYWFTTNLWSLGQQMYVIHHMPAPGSLAEENLRRRREAAGKSSAAPAAVTAPSSESELDGEAAAQPGSSPAGVGNSPAAGNAQAKRQQQRKRKARSKRR